MRDRKWFIFKTEWPANAAAPWTAYRGNDNTFESHDFPTWGEAAGYAFERAGVRA